MILSRVSLIIAKIIAIINFNDNNQFRKHGRRIRYLC